MNSFNKKLRNVYERVDNRETAMDKYSIELRRILAIEDGVDRLNEMEEFVFNNTPTIDSIYDKRYEILTSVRFVFASREEQEDALSELDIVYCSEDEIMELVLYKELADLYYKEGLYRQAFRKYESVIKVNPLDIFGVGYKIPTALIHVHDEESLLKYVKSYNYRGSESFLLALIIFYINDGNLEQANYYMTLLKRLNPQLGELFKRDYLPVEYLERDIESIYTHNLDGLTFALRNSDEYVLNDYYFSALKYLYNSPENTRAAALYDVDESDMREDSTFSNLKTRALNSLFNAELLTKEILEFHTEEEVLEFEGIGKKTIEILKENGVKFKEE